MPWICNNLKCIVTNFAGNRQCAGCKISRPESVTQNYINAEWRLEFGVSSMRVNKTQDEIYELHAKFFNDEAGFVAKLDFNQLEERIQELEQYAFEAKARLSSATQKQREMKALLDKDNRDKLIDNPNLLVSDSIAAVKKRADRMSTAEKLVKDMREAGIDEATIKLMMADVKIDEPKSNVLKATFNKPAPAAEPTAKVEEPKAEESKPVDTSFLGGLF